MKTLMPHLFVACLCLTQCLFAAPATTAFTYQGRLHSGSTAANGLYEMQFTLFDAAMNGNPVGIPVALAPVPVSNGLFTVSLDFGVVPFNGSARWLEITLNIFGSDMVPITLHPRQPITAAPYTLYAVNAGALMSFGSAPIDIKVNDQRILRLEPNADGDPNIVGGAADNHVASGVFGSIIAGGGTGLLSAPRYHRIASDYGTISGGGGNTIDAGSDYSTIAGGIDNAIGAGSYNGTIGGGIFNRIANNSWENTIAGGVGHYIDSYAQRSFIGGGNYHRIGVAARWSTIGGGSGNLIGLDSDHSFIGGGLNHNINSNSSFSAISGGRENSVGPNAQYGTVAGGHANNAAAASSTISGGRRNAIGTNSPNATIGGGIDNAIEASADGSTVSGGNNNSIGRFSTHGAIGGGKDNTVSALAWYSTIAGGSLNVIATNSEYSTIAGGTRNSVGTNSAYSTILAGLNNTIANNSSRATVVGGESNYATTRALAAGTFARAEHRGSFVWADSSLGSVSSTNADSVTMRANGGYRFFSDSNLLSGVFLPHGAGSWTSISDRNAKENFQPVDSRAILEKVAALPLTTWNYKAQPDSVRHLGPMAQDFKTAFGLGESETGITAVDADGVALAAIQGLNEKLGAELRAKDAELRELKTRLLKLEQLLSLRDQVNDAE